MATKKVNETYCIRKSGHSWFVDVYDGWGLDKRLSSHDCGTFALADSFARGLDIPDGDKGPEMADVRGHNVQR